MPGSSAAPAALERALVALADHHRIAHAQALALWTVAGADAWTARAGASGLCADGTPIELSVSLGAECGGLRYVSSIGRGASAWARLVDTRAQLPQLMSALSLPSEVPLSVLDRFLPRSPSELPPVRFGIWVGGAFRPDRTRLKLYVNTGWRRLSDVRSRVFAALEEHAGAAVLGPAEAMIEALASLRRVSFVGLECGHRGIDSLKLYFRGGAVGIDRLEALARLANDRTGGLARLWRRFFGAASSASEQALLSVQIPLDGRAPTLKCDVEIELLGTPPDRTVDRVRSVLRCEGIDDAPYVTTLEVLERITGVAPRHTVIGFGVCDDRPKINLYLKPELAPLR